MKRIRQGLVILLAFLLLMAACQSAEPKEILQDAEEIMDDTTMSMKYSKFSGERSKTFAVEEGQEAWIQIDIETVKGSLDISITDQEGNSIYGGTNIENSSSFSVGAPSGTYTIKVTGHEHQGSYSFVWNRQEIKKDASITERISVEDKAHNVFQGTIGDRNVAVDIFPDKELFEAYVTMTGTGIGGNDPYKGTYDLQGSILYESDEVSFILSQEEEGKLKGSFTGFGISEAEVSLTLSHITYSGSLEKRYVIGDNEDVESFASEVIHILDIGDYEALSTLVHYPITVMGSEDVQLQNERELVEYGSKLLTPELKKSLDSSFTKFMFSNYNGIMLGDGYYNIWFQPMEDGTYKITAINH